LSQTVSLVDLLLNLRLVDLVLLQLVPLFLMLFIVEGIDIRVDLFGKGQSLLFAETLLTLLAVHLQVELTLHGVLLLLASVDASDFIILLFLQLFFKVLLSLTVSAGNGTFVSYKLVRDVAYDLIIFGSALEGLMCFSFEQLGHNVLLRLGTSVDILHLLSEGALLILVNINDLSKCVHLFKSLLSIGLVLLTQLSIQLSALVGLILYLLVGFHPLLVGKVHQLLAGISAALEQLHLLFFDLALLSLSSLVEFNDLLGLEFSFLVITRSHFSLSLVDLHLQLVLQVLTLLNGLFLLSVLFISLSLHVFLDDLVPLVFRHSDVFAVTENKFQITDVNVTRGSLMLERSARASDGNGF